MEWAEHEFRRSRKTADGATEGDHAESAARQWAKVPPALMRPGVRRPIAKPPSAPDFPYELDYLWGWFREICLGVASGGFGPPMITWDILRAWSSLMAIHDIEPWEAKALIALSALRASIMAEDIKSKTPPKPEPKGRRR